MAFSLVELLVVMAIIALLVSLLLPMRRFMIERSDLVVCQKNLGAINQATYVYSADNDGRFPSSKSWVKSDGRQSGGIWVEWAQDHPLAESRILPYAGYNKKLFLCPRFQSIVSLNPSFSHLTAKVSYTMNEYFLNSDNMSISTGWRGARNLHRSNIQDPGRFGVYGEENTFLTSFNRFTINNLRLGVGAYKNAGDIVDGLGSFHEPPGGDYAKGAGNVASADGHVSKQYNVNSKEIFTPLELK